MASQTPDLAAIGLNFDRWQDAVEAAIAADKLRVTGEVRGGQLISYDDPSGAKITILAVEPFATFAGFTGTTRALANVTMMNDVLALCDILDPTGKVQTTVTVNLAQGPLLVDEPDQFSQEIGITALVTQHRLYPHVEAFTAETGKDSYGSLTSHGATTISSGLGATAPDASVDFDARVLDAEYLTTELTGDRFIHLTVDGAFPFDVCLPDAPELPTKDSILSGFGVFTGTLFNTAEYAGGCGGCGDSCGCGGCGGGC